MLKVYAIDGIASSWPAVPHVLQRVALSAACIRGSVSYFGPCACSRGHFGRIVIEEGANIQDCGILHAFPDRGVVVEADGHIGHGAVLHGCVVKKNAMVGINSVVNDNALVGESSIVGAMAFVKAGFEVPPRSLVLGVPGKVVRELSADELAWKRDATRQYQALAARSLATMKETAALAEVEANRKRFRDASVMPLSEMKKGSPK